MADTVVLHGVEIALNSPEGVEFVRDCTRAGEALITDDEVKSKYEIPNETFATLIKNKTLARAIRAESEKRIRSGLAARESAAKIHAKAPAVLGTILDDKGTHPRFRIEAAKEIRTTAIGSDDVSAPSAAEKFHIVINLGADHIEHYVKDITPPVKQLPPGGDADWGWTER